MRVPNLSALAADVETYQDEALSRFIRGDLDVDDDAEWQNYNDPSVTGYSAVTEGFHCILHGESGDGTGMRSRRIKKKTEAELFFPSGGVFWRTPSEFE